MGISVSVVLEDQLCEIRKSVSISYGGLPSQFVAKDLAISALTLAESTLNPQGPQASDREPNLESGCLHEGQSGISK